jgi:hypothetical protein
MENDQEYSRSRVGFNAKNGFHVCVDLSQRLVLCIIVGAFFGAMAYTLYWIGLAVLWLIPLVGKLFSLLMSNVRIRNAFFVTIVVVLITFLLGSFGVIKPSKRV